ncbi:hypothetical protein GF343_02860 [Candidatus Woesearchaeota archaeon]|nr:hypothetical protein [Candidatus Woesearchaeota archaeon]
MKEKPRIKVKFQETRVEEVTYKQAEDLETIAKQRRDAQQAVSKVESELQTLEGYESLPEHARTILESTRLSLGQDYLKGLLSHVVGMLYREEIEEKVLPSDVTEWETMKRGTRWHPDPEEREDKIVTMRQVGPEKVEKIPYLDPVTDTGMRLLSKKRMQESVELGKRIKGLYQEQKVKYLTFELASGKKEAVQELGEDVMSFIKKYLRTLDEVEYLAKSGSLYERYKDEIIEEPKPEIPK